MENFLDGQAFDLFKEISRIEIRSVMGRFLVVNQFGKWINFVLFLATTVNVKGMSVPYDEIQEAIEKWDEIFNFLFE